MFRYLNVSTIFMCLVAIFCFIFLVAGGTEGDKGASIAFGFIGVSAAVMVGYIIYKKAVYVSGLKRKLQIVIDSIHKDKKNILDRYNAIKDSITDPVEASEVKVLMDDLVDEMDDTVVYVGEIRESLLSDLEDPKAIFELEPTLQGYAPMLESFHELISGYESKRVEAQKS